MALSILALFAASLAIVNAAPLASLPTKISPCIPTEICQPASQQSGGFESGIMTIMTIAAREARVTPFNPISIMPISPRVPQETASFQPGGPMIPVASPTTTTTAISPPFTTHISPCIPASICQPASQQSGGFESGIMTIMTVAAREARVTPFNPISIMPISSSAPQDTAFQPGGPMIPASSESGIMTIMTIAAPAPQVTPFNPISVVPISSSAPQDTAFQPGGPMLPASPTVSPPFTTHNIGVPTPRVA